VTDTQWKVLCAEFGLAALADDPALATQAERRAARPRTLPVIAAAFAQFSAAELVASCERLGLPFAPIAKPADLFADPHLRESGGLVEVSLPDGRKIGLPGLPISMDGARSTARRDVPAPGADTRDVLAELGYPAAEIDRLIETGAAG
ncbi:MAG: formyl-CoA transferase, partial [Acidiphilium sp. 21-68-69]